MARKYNIETRQIDGELWYKFNDNYDKWRYKFGNYVAFFLIFVLIALGSTLFLFTNNHLKELKANPFIYGAENLKDQGELFCSCNLKKYDGKTAFFKFNSTSLWDPYKNKPTYDVEVELRSFIDSLKENG